MSETLEGFILTRQWRDAREGVEFEFWLATSEGPARVIVTGQEPVFFVERSSEGIAEARREQLELKNFAGRAMDGLYFSGERTLRDARDHLKAKAVQTYESDDKREGGYLLERFILGGGVVDGWASTSSAGGGNRGTGYRTRGGALRGRPSGRTHRFAGAGGGG